jgi:energy-coupling factor transporter ATP-binding protein EcfA2
MLLNKNKGGTADHLAEAAAKAGLPNEALQAARTWLAEKLVAEEYAKLGQGGHTQNQVPLKRVFIDLPVTNTPSPASHDGSARIPFLASLLSSGPIDLRAACDPEQPGVLPIATGLGTDGPGGHPTEARSKARTRDSDFGAVLLVGGPGQGKSTLGQLACQFHRAALLKPVECELSRSQREILHTFEAASATQPTKEIPLAPPLTPFLPLQISLPDLAAWMDKAPISPPGANTDILAFVTNLPSATNSGLTADTLFALACTLPSLIVLDGLDEVGAAQDRERIVAAARDLLTALAKRGASAQIVAATRPQGYAGELAHIGLNLRACYLAPLLRNEALSYADKLVEAKIPGADLQKKTLDRLREAAAEPATERLLTTPLQVTILTALVQQGRAPRERWKLFWSYFDYTYKREIERETYASRLLAEHRSHIEAIHARVALLLQVEAERAGGAAARMPRDRLREIVNAVLLEDGIEEVTRNELVGAIVVAAEQRLVFLVEPEPGSFGFEIRSLQEFMAAWALTSGRDTEVEARLVDVVKAPMFRNVTLFIASRLFSEGSPLRDILADQLCRGLDEDPHDPLARMTRSGAILALDILEEGAVLAQPKRARTLMTRATGLLDLPPGMEHARLARVANSDTYPVLQSAIERCIARSADKAPTSVQGAWACLITAIDRQDAWAKTLGEATWTALTASPALFRACVQGSAPIGDWLATKLDSSAQDIPPEDFVSLFDPSVQETTRVSAWSAWLGTVYKKVATNWQRHRRHNRLGMSAAVQQLHIAEPQSLLPPPLAWRAWIAAAQYEICPTADHLAAAIEVVAETLPLERWNALARISTWPLAACLLTADSAQVLLGFVPPLRAGLLGDITDWTSAQVSWQTKTARLSALGGLPEPLPWDRESLQDKPPLMSIDAWAYGQHGEESQIAGTLSAAADLFATARSSKVRRHAADICLRVLRELPAATATKHLQWADWLREFPAGIVCLVPRPPALEQTEWQNALDAVPEDQTPGYAPVPLDSLMTSLVETNCHAMVLRVAVQSLAFRLFDAGGADNTILRSRVARILESRKYATVDSRAESAIMRIFLGAIRDGEDSSVAKDISTAASRNPGLWSAALSAIDCGAMSPPRAIQLSARIYAEMEGLLWYARFAIDQARRNLESRRSSLDSPTIWDRLGLPMPYPRVPEAQTRGGIPTAPIVIKSLEVRDVRCLRHLKLTLNLPSENAGQWVVLLGPNGSGKTTLLRSLALLLRNARDPAIWPKGTFAERWPRAVSGGEAPIRAAQMRLSLSDDVIHETLIRSNGTTTILQDPEVLGPRLFPLFAYGCRRGSALGGAAREVVLKDEGGPEIATLFDDEADLIHAETWLLQWDGAAQKSANSRTVFEAVTEAMKMFLNLESINVSDRKLWVKEAGRPAIPFSALSDGYLTSAGWFLDLVARWISLAERQSATIKADFLQHMRGLVLIDEIDLHIHPRWQIEIIDRTRRLLPQMSFVVTTHNPLTLVGAKAEEIWILTCRDGHIEAFPGLETPMLLTGGQIYHRYFGIEDIYPNGLGRKLQRYGFLCGYALRSEAEQVELEELATEIRASGIDPGWEVTARVDSNAGAPSPSTPGRRRSKRKSRRTS